MEDFTYEDIKNLISGLVIGEVTLENSTYGTQKGRDKSILEIKKAHESLKKLRKKLEFKDDPYTWDYGWNRREKLKNKL